MIKQNDLKIILKPILSNYRFKAFLGEFLSIRGHQRS